MIKSNLGLLVVSGRVACTRCQISVGAIAPSAPMLHWPLRINLSLFSEQSGNNEFTYGLTLLSILPHLLTHVLLIETFQILSNIVCL